MLVKKKRKRNEYEDDTGDIDDKSITTTKKKGGKKNIREKIKLDSNFIAIIYDFVKNDEFCNKYSDFLKSRIFQLGWEIHVKNTFILQIFEYPLLKSKFQNFLYNCRSFVRIFGFCIYYVVNDIDKWLKKYSSLDDFDKNHYKLPFGFVNVNDVDIYSETEDGKFESQLKVYPKMSKLSRKYKFFVYYYDYVEDTLRMNNSTYHSQQQQYSFMNDNTNMSGVYLIKPYSKFTILRERKIKLKEAVNSRDNANFMSCHPETWVIPEQLKEIPLENLSEGNLYTFDDLEDGQSRTNQRYSRVLLKYAQENLKKIQNASYPTQTDVNNRDKIKRLYHHIDLKDGLQIIPSESSKIYKSHDPKSLIDIQIEMDEYNEFVASIYKLPKSIFSIQDIKKNQRLNQSTQSSYIKLIEKEVEYEQRIINDIFIDIYSNSFGVIEKSIKNDVFNRNKENTIIVFKQSKVITEEQLMVLIQLYERQLITEAKFKEIIEQWI